MLFRSQAAFTAGISSSFVVHRGERNSNLVDRSPFGANPAHAKTTAARLKRRLQASRADIGTAPCSRSTAGDARAVPSEAARVMMHRGWKRSGLKARAPIPAQRRGNRRAMVAPARKTGLTMLQLRAGGSAFRLGAVHALAAKTAKASHRLPGSRPGAPLLAGSCSRGRARGEPE